MSPSRRDILAVIAGTAVAGTLTTPAACAASPEAVTTPLEITAFVRYHTDGLRERMPLVTLTIDPEDDTLTVCVAHVSDPDRGRSRIYLVGAEVIQNLVDDTEELYQARS
ncbi:MAG: hypothetical protein WBA46_06960, partial [Thermomicrobiales bacterium]